MRIIEYLVLILLITIPFINCSNPVSEENTFKADGYYIDHIFFSSPFEGSVWKPGQEYEIKWTAFGNIKKVNLILLKKKRYHKIIIAEKIENDLSYSWKIPLDIINSVSYQIKIENSDKPEQFYYSEYFEISGRE